MARLDFFDLNKCAHTDGCFDCEDDMMRQSNRYLRSLRLWPAVKELINKHLTRIETFSWERRVCIAIESFGLFVHLHRHYPGRLQKYEMAVLSEAVTLAWRVTPDSWVGLHMLLDMLAERIATDDLQMLDESARETLKVRVPFVFILNRSGVRYAE